MPRIRLAQKGWNGSQAAESHDDVQVGIGCMWVEIDGQRITDVTGVEFRAHDDGINLPELVVGVVGALEIVYTDRLGNPLPGSPLGVESSVFPEHVNHATVMPRQDRMGSESDPRWYDDPAVAHAAAQLVRHFDDTDLPLDPRSMAVSVVKALTEAGYINGGAEVPEGR